MDEIAQRGIEIPVKWNYGQSVEKMKAVVYKWKNLTIEMLHELWIAHEVLTNQGARTDLVADATKSPTWEQYCQDIGIDRGTAWRWLKRYDPTEKRLIEQAKQIEPPGEEKDYSDMTADEICQDMRDLAASIRRDLADTFVRKGKDGNNEIIVRQLRLPKLYYMRAMYRRWSELAEDADPEDQKKLILADSDLEHELLPIWMHYQCPKEYYDYERKRIFYLLTAWDVLKEENEFLDSE